MGIFPVILTHSSSVDLSNTPRSSMYDNSSSRASTTALVSSAFPLISSTAHSSAWNSISWFTSRPFTCIVTSSFTLVTSPLDVDSSARFLLKSAQGTGSPWAGTGRSSSSTITLFSRFGTISSSSLSSTNPGIPSALSSTSLFLAPCCRFFSSVSRASSINFLFLSFASATRRSPAKASVILFRHCSLCFWRAVPPRNKALHPGHPRLYPCV